MGKKDLKKRKREDEEDEENEDPELEAELEAVRAIRAEKNADSTSGETDISKPTFNKEGLLKCIADLDLDLGFAETMQIDEFVLDITDENDDLDREMNFYNHTLQAVQLGRKKLEKLGIPTSRPTDYFCENMKSDAHMAKVKDRLLLEEKKMEAFEKRKNQEQNRKYNKQVAALRKEEKTLDKKNQIKQVAQLRKNQDSDEGSVEGKLQNILKPKKFGDKSLKRKNMDKKYGFGGKDRKRAKLNDKKSLNDLSDFNPRGGKFVRRESSKSVGKKNNNKPKRLGKEARTKQRKSRSS